MIVSYNSHVNDFVLYLNCDMYMLYKDETQIKNASLYTMYTVFSKIDCSKCTVWLSYNMSMFFFQKQLPNRRIHADMVYLKEKC